MYKSLTYYNDCKNTPLCNDKIQEAIRTVLDNGEILDANNVIADIFSHNSNTQRENVNAIFIIE